MSIDPIIRHHKRNIFYLDCLFIGVVVAIITAVLMLKVSTSAREQFHPALDTRDLENRVTELENREE